MRPTTLCCLFLALLFTLSSVHHPKTVHGGDALPPDCCKFFCEADFAPLDAKLLSRPFERTASGSATRKVVTRKVVTRKVTTPMQTLFVPPTSRKWNFSYGAKGQTKKQKLRQSFSVIALRRQGHICFRLNPRMKEPLRISKPVRGIGSSKQIASLLFGKAGSTVDLTILMRLFANEAATTFTICTSPLEQLPMRAVRLASDLILIQ